MSEGGVLTFGEALLKLALPQAHRIEDMRAIRAECGGSELNVAAALRALGRPAAWISALPDGPLGDWARAQVRMLGVQDFSVERSGRLGSFYLEDHHPPRPSRVIYDRQGTAFQALTAADLSPSWLTGQVAFHVSGISLALGPGPQELALALVTAARERKVLVSFDVNHRRKLLPDAAAVQTYGPAARHADVIFVAQRDAGLLGGVSDLRALNPRALLVVTCGAQGSQAHLPGGEIVHQPAFAAAGPGRVGRGDAFAGGFLHAWLGQATPAQALQFASACAALKTTLPGDQLHVSDGDLKAVLAGSESGEPLR
ncbi:sugar kinase [Deinococcus deserti]|uniref:Putative 2-keto-3-deoxygluconate kinase n=1 Tax=Deinococcus deserti (strain DSM 17065 / CIP 109153 / LMG 22923 / VCD115) TaxID=546414 RepID=C1D2H6_DEIDV|nr:sugar kinase [Deinococcus deserti]ACO47615.1 putative 2-keto-3-deoxygluconate kinase [Deinococcus deserti VCD115]